ncbi:helix-turn-helix transcriptional regulator [Brevundimonas nasdae]|uniref:Helix-turn-helix transcriptional regulator n=1 Tax=Brevundimonas nasdae TaxID=172043 RepID=A0ACD4VLG2_9CAUL|nr:helix-turn-helix transcriptional regulator [Brevundimonas nasdae]WOB78358.1 helix-turn-helix transcriptional regulator [Brevundimonas nasdae]
MSTATDNSPHPIDVTVGARITSLRLAKGMTQTDLATKIGVSFQQVQKYERGSNRVSASRLWRTAEALDVPMTFFFDGVTTDAGAPREERPVTPWARELMALEKSLPASARRLVLNMARQLAERETTASGV